jgi:hypothetical protein
MKRTTLSAVAVALAVPMALASVQAASAATPAKGHMAKVATNAHPSSKIPAAPLGAVKGYHQVSSSPLADPANGQVEGTVACPSGTLALSGGAVISGSSLLENLNASFPLSGGAGWGVYVNNASATSGTFTVYAVCATNILNYQVFTGTGVDNPAGLQSEAVVTCPSGAPLGGGGVASSGATTVNLNSSFPLKKGWRADANNGSTGGDTITPYVVCGTKPKLYQQVAGTTATNTAGSQTNASAACPTGTEVLGGGSLSGSGSTTVNLNTTIPAGMTGWSVYEDNSGSSDASLTAYALCGKVKA